MAKHYSMDECCRHCSDAIQKQDICIEPLKILAKSKIKKLQKLKSPFFKRHLQKLIAIAPEYLVSLAPVQRRYLAKIHGSGILQKELCSLASHSKQETIIHGDYRFANLLFRKKAPLLHVIDWELSEIGPPVFDWSTLMADYIAVYLNHYFETRSHPTQLKWEQIEMLMRRHFMALSRSARDYLQWIGVFLLHKGCIVANGTPYGSTMSDLFFQMGRRFLAEHDQLQKKYFQP